MRELEGDELGHVMTGPMPEKRTRDPLDRYYTPRWPTLELLRHIDLSDRPWVWEPCAGRGGISDVLGAAYRFWWPYIVTSDVDPGVPHDTLDFMGDIDTVHDYLYHHIGYEPLRPVWIITNPPYTLSGGVKASDFVKRSLALAPSVAMLLRANWAEACRDRWELFRDRPPTLIVHLPRVQFHSVGKKMSSNPGHSCWFVWDGDAVATTRTVWADPSCRPPRPKVQRAPSVVAPLREPGIRPPQVEHTKGRAMHHTLSLFR